MATSPNERLELQMTVPDPIDEWKKMFTQKTEYLIEINGDK